MECRAGPAPMQFSPAGSSASLNSHGSSPWDVRAFAIADTWYPGPDEAPGAPMLELLPQEVRSNPSRAANHPSDPMLKPFPSWQLIIEILTYLSLEAKSTFLRCSRRARDLSCSPPLWTSVVVQRYSRRRTTPFAWAFGLFLGHVLPRAGTAVRALVVANLETRFADEHLMQVARWCPNLRELDVAGTSVSDRGMRYVFGGLDSRWEGGVDAVGAGKGKGPGPPVAPPRPRPPGTARVSAWEPEPDGQGPSCDDVEPPAPTKPRCGNLERLTLSNVRSLTDATLHALAPHAAQLTHVDLSTVLAGSFSERGVCALAAAASERLEALTVAGCAGVTDRVVAVLADGACGRSLRVLDLSGCFNVTAVGIERILGACAALEVLDLSFCHNVDDRAFAGFKAGGAVVACRGLRTLRLGFCYGVTDDCVEVLLGFPELEFVDLVSTGVSDGCRRVMMRRGIFVGKDDADPDRTGAGMFGGM
ncbi:hypothetical protein HDU96_007964 [Phlyctochytrium bullatum]|nr:hypothetical protein HDU96_007964 [Phlyctochytrium bullatum]